MINIEMLVDMFDGNTDVVKAVFEQYLSDNQEINARIDSQFEQNQLEALFDTMHSLSGSLSNICETDIVATIKEVEMASRQGNKSNSESIEQIKIELDNINQQMQDYLAQ